MKVELWMKHGDGEVKSYPFDGTHIPCLYDFIGFKGMVGQVEKRLFNTANNEIILYMKEIK